MLCIEATINARTLEASASVQMMEASAMAVSGIDATMHAAGNVDATMSQTAAFVATMTASLVDCYISYSCPIAYIESCFSLGGWDDDLGWDDEVGWKN